MVILSFILFATAPGGYLVTREFPSKSECVAVVEAAQAINEVKGATYFCVEKAEK